MHKKLHDTAEKLLDSLCGEIESQGLHVLCAEEVGAVTDMIKDLCEAAYYEQVVKAMDEAQEPERMGDDRYRYANGRFAPKGRGTYQGYTPTITPEMGYPTGERMGYPMPRDMDSYNVYRDRLRSYTQNKTADNRKAMEQSASDHLRESMDTMREMWAGVDQPMRQKVKQDLTNLVNELH